MADMRPVDPNLVPKLKLKGGEKMPMIGMGTFGSDRYDAAQVAGAVRGAARAGYRLFDCASVYGNEALIGPVFAEIMGEGVSRDELFITSKVWNDMHGPGQAIASCEQTLRDLRLDYVDLFFVHWPFPNFHPKGAAPDYHNPDSRPFIIQEFMGVWQQLQTLKARGLTRHIGVSNMTIPKMELFLKECGEPPAAVEMEMHPCFQQEELLRYMVGHGIAPIGFCPLGSPERPERDVTPGDVSDMEHPVVQAIAAAHGVHPALVCLKWAVQRGHAAIPFSVRPEEYISNLRAVTEDPLTDQEMRAIKAVESGCRLVKGQVFLWGEHKDWRLLWDEDGAIAGW